jgi:DNA-binding GntR family transcriptional regulator
MTLGLSPGGSRAQTAHVYVRDSLREAIMDGRLPGGTRLIQAELAAQLSVSNTPVREALRDLAGEGLVVFDPHRGSRVRSLDIDEVRELYEMRMALEPLAVRRVMASISTEALDRASKLCDQLERTTNVTEWSELNREFHGLLSLPDNGCRLASVLNGLRDSASMYVALSLGADTDRISDSNVEHAKLIEFYRARDTEAAIEMTVQHLRATLAAIEDAHHNNVL